MVRGAGASRVLPLALVAAFLAACKGSPRAGPDAGACVPGTCLSLGKNCGTPDDGCGQPLSCGTCVGPQTCGGAGVAHSCGAPGDAAVVVAVGDIACDSADSDFAGTATECRMRATHLLTTAVDPAAVLLLGDIQYPSGALDSFNASFDPIWGDLKPRAHPAPGNHEYGTAGAAGYFAYFGAAAGEAGKGYYSFDLGSWHLVSLNSNCTQAGGCGVGSAQHTWLQADLAASPRPCTLAFWHHPRFSSGLHGNDSTTAALWDALAAAGGELILTGHDHHYERFAPQSSSGAADPTAGLREFVVGTGGKSLYPEVTVRPNSQVRFHDGFGVLRLTLRPTGYDWQFLAEPGQAFVDSGSAECH